MNQEIIENINAIEHLDEEAMKMAKNRQMGLIKSPRSLGKLEDISIKLAGITGEVNNDLDRRRIIVLCADNGVCEEGISSSPVSDTAFLAINMTKRLTGMSSMAKAFGDDVQVVDMGMSTEYESEDIVTYPIAKGTKNFLKEDAMTYEQCEDAILVGIKLAKHAKEQRIDVVGVGELGIGNTTTSAAVLSVLKDLPAADVTGRGSGLSDKAYERKIKVISDGIKLRNPQKDDVIDVLSKLGGFDIAAMTGVFLGCARYKIPVVIDGFISSVAAVCAKRLNPTSVEYMFPSHKSCEIGYTKAIEELGLEPYLDLNMKLGEGSGCVLAFEILSAACTVINDMACRNE